MLSRLMCDLRSQLWSISTNLRAVLGMCMSYQSICLQERTICCSGRLKTQMPVKLLRIKFSLIQAQSVSPCRGRTNTIWAFAGIIDETFPVYARNASHFSSNSCKFRKPNSFSTKSSQYLKTSMKITKRLLKWASSMIWSTGRFIRSRRT